MAKPPKPQKFREAVEWFRKRVPMTRDEVDALEERARKRAFYVSNVAQLRLVAEVQGAISKAIEEGTTLADFKREVGGRLAKEWGAESPATVETVFRNNVQAAYNAGRLEMFDDPIVKRLRPYRGFAVVLDRRTTEFICKPLKDVVVPADSAFARSHVPPLHHRCRTGIMALAAEDSQLSENVPAVPPQQGFGGDPREMPPVDLSGTPDSLRRIFDKKTKGEGVTEDPDSG